LNGIAHILIRDGLADREYIRQHTNGFDELCGFLEKYEPAYVSRVTGLSPELIERVAHLYGNAKAGFIGWTMGREPQLQGHGDGERDQ
jgi:assimilatory nitrate reductase catalytic subunit